MQEQNQLTRLDWVLHYAAEKAYDGLTMDELWKDGVIKRHPSLHIENNPSYRHQILNKLKDDGLLKFDELGDEKFWITLKGVIFSDYGKGGYVQEKRFLDAEKAWKTRLESLSISNGNRLNILTGALVLATLFLALIEVAHLSCP